MTAESSVRSFSELLSLGGLHPGRKSWSVTGETAARSLLLFLFRMTGSWVSLGSLTRVHNASALVSPEIAVS